MGNLPPEVKTDDDLRVHLSMQTLPDYIDALEKEDDRAWANRVYAEFLRPLPADPGGAAAQQGDQGDAGPQPPAQNTPAQQYAEGSGAEVLLGDDGYYYDEQGNAYYEYDGKFFLYGDGDTGDTGDGGDGYDQGGGDQQSYDAQQGDGDQQGYPDQGAGGDGQGDDGQGVAANAPQYQYDPDLLQDNEWRPLDGRFNFVVRDDDMLADLEAADGHVFTVRHRAQLQGGCSGTVEIKQGVAERWRVRAGALSDKDGEVKQRNIRVFNALVANVATGEERTAKAFYSPRTGIVFADADEPFKPQGQLGPEVSEGVITFYRRRVGANDLKVGGGVDPKLVGSYLKQLLDSGEVTYPYRDRGRLKPG